MAIKRRQNAGKGKKHDDGEQPGQGQLSGFAEVVVIKRVELMLHIDELVRLSRQSVLRINSGLIACSPGQKRQQRHSSHCRFESSESTRSARLLPSSALRSRF